jgi:hypothetical protein
LAVSELDATPGVPKLELGNELTPGVAKLEPGNQNGARPGGLKAARRKCNNNNGLTTPAERRMIAQAVVGQRRDRSLQAILIGGRAELLFGVARR